MRSLTLALLLVALMTIPVLDQAQAKEKEWDDWKFDIGIYVPFTNIAGDASMVSPSGGETDLPIDLRFRDIPDYWKGGINGVLSLKRERWSFNLDLSYVKVERDMPVPALADDDVDVTTGLAVSEHEFFIGYQINEQDHSVSEIIFGTRYIGHNMTFDATYMGEMEEEVTVAEEMDENWWMGFIGARHVGQLFGAENWIMMIRADVGTFDTSGRITWRANLGAEWMFAEHFSLALMYKWMGIDYKKGEPGDDDYYYYKATEHGPVIGLGIDF